MITRYGHIFVTMVVVLTSLIILVSSCAPHPTVAPSLPAIAAVTPTDTPQPTATPTDTPQLTATPTLEPSPTAAAIPLSALAWNPGDSYFSINGRPAFTFSRNLAGWNPNDWEAFAGLASIQGDHFVRVSTSSASMGGIIFL